MRRFNWKHAKVEELYFIGYSGLAMLADDVGHPWVSNTFATLALICLGKAIHLKYKERHLR